MEVREFTVRTAEWIRVSFTQPFSRDPVVVVAPTKGKGPAAIRVRKITTTGFSAIIAKPPKSGKVEPGGEDRENAPVRITSLTYSIVFPHGF